MLAAQQLQQRVVLTHTCGVEGAEGVRRRQPVEPRGREGSDAGGEAVPGGARTTLVLKAGLPRPSVTSRSLASSSALSGWTASMKSCSRCGPSASQTISL